MNRRAFLGTAGVLGTAGLAATIASQGGDDGDGYDTVRVPADEPTIQRGVNAASGGDLVLVAPGTYEEAVEVTTPGITLRGRDRNGVVLDGGFDLEDAVHVEADGVAVENLTARHYQRNAVYWSGVQGFRGSFLTAYNNGYYGIYAYDSRDGRFEYSHASGHPDAGFYLGRHQPYEAVVEGVVAEHNAIGYSGTSTGAALTVRNSVFRHNWAGIVPNTLDERDPPQHSTDVVGNYVHDNGNEDAPGLAYIAAAFGMGIVLWGGSVNLVEDNVVDGHPNFGVVAAHNVVEPSGNAVRDNVVRDSGRADLALGTPASDDNEFADNLFASSWPEGIQADASEGAERVADVFAEQERRADQGDLTGGDWREQPEPGAQPTMPDPEAPPRPATKSESWVE